MVLFTSRRQQCLLFLNICTFKGIMFIMSSSVFMSLCIMLCIKGDVMRWEFPHVRIATLWNKPDWLRVFVRYLEA